MTPAGSASDALRSSRWYVSEDLSRATGQEFLRVPHPSGTRWPPSQGIAGVASYFGSPCRTDGIPSDGVDLSKVVEDLQKVVAILFKVVMVGSTGGRWQDGVANPSRQEGRGLPTE